MLTINIDKTKMKIETQITRKKIHNFVLADW